MPAKKKHTQTLPPLRLDERLLSMLNAGVKTARDNRSAFIRRAIERECRRYGIYGLGAMENEEILLIYRGLNAVCSEDGPIAEAEAAEFINAIFLFARNERPSLAPLLDELESALLDAEELGEYIAAHS